MKHFIITKAAGLNILWLWDSKLEKFEKLDEGITVTVDQSLTEAKAGDSEENFRFFWIEDDKLHQTPQYCSDIKKYDNSDYYKGEIGKIGGVRFVESTESKIFCGEDLASDARNLKVSSVSGTTVNFTGGTVAENALEGRFVLIHGNKYEIESNTASQITLTEEPSDAQNNDIIYPGEGGAEGCAVFAVTVIGANAYATTSLTGAGLEHIVKPLGSGGTSDPLNQRSTVGWKATKAAERLVEEYMVRVECGSTYSGKAKAN